MKRTPLRRSTVARIVDWQRRSRRPLPRHRRGLDPALRARVLARHGGRCAVTAWAVTDDRAGHWAPDVDAVVAASRLSRFAAAAGCTGLAVDPHHVLPRGRGGADVAWNLVPLCRPCHDRVGTHPLEAAEAGLLTLNRKDL